MIPGSKHTPRFKEEPKKILQKLTALGITALWRSGFVDPVVPPPRPPDVLGQGGDPVEPVIGHLKAEHRMGHNHLAHASGDAINAALADDKNLLVTPGVYHLDQTLRVTRPDTVVLGLGLATFIPDNGVTPMQVADVDGVKLPFRLRRAIGPDTTEETTFDRFRLNTKIDPRKIALTK